MSATNSNAVAEKQVTRRDFLRRSGTFGATIAGATVGLMSQVSDVEAKNSDADTTWSEWFQTHYALMTDEERAESVARLEKRYSAQFGKEVTVDTTPAMEGVLFGYGLNIQKCIGCRRCVKACVRENNQSRENAAGTPITPPT